MITASMVLIRGIWSVSPSIVPLKSSLPSLACHKLFSTLAEDEKEKEYNWDPKKEHSEKLAICFFFCFPLIHLAFQSFRTHQSHSASSSAFKKVQLDLLREALLHVPKYGWGAASFSEAAKVLKMSPSLMNSFHKREDVTLVLFFLDLKMVDLENFLIDVKAKHIEEFGRIKINNFVMQACKELLSYVIPYMEHWPEALAILGDVV